MIANPYYPIGSDTPEAPWNEKEYDQPLHCDTCLECFDYWIDIDDDGHDVVVPVIPVETSEGQFCSAKCAGEDE